MDKKIIKIIIKGESGFGPRYLACKDQLTLTEHSISYTKKPLASEVEIDPDLKEQFGDVEQSKWTYKTESKIFTNAFYEFAKEMENAVKNYNDLCLDVGLYKFIFYYEGGSKFKKEIFVSPDYFEKQYQIINKLVPAIEEIML